jgi:hypothetical protein
MTDNEDNLDESIEELQRVIDEMRDELARPVNIEDDDESS